MPVKVLHTMILLPLYVPSKKGYPATEVFFTSESFETMYSVSTFMAPKIKTVLTGDGKFELLMVCHYNENDFHRHVLNFLTSIHEDCENYGLDVCALSDLQHYTNYVAGALSEKTQIENIPVFSKEESGFNDVFVGFDKGVESAQHKNYQ